MNRIRAMMIGPCVFLLGACASGPDYRKPDVAVPARFDRGQEIVPDRGDGADGAWWAGFHDPVLSTAIGTALAQNLDIAQAAARVAQARAALAGSDAALLPRADLDTATASTRNSLRSPIGEVAHAVGAPRSYHTQDIGTQASWEIDLFGSLRRGRESARAQAQAAEVEAAAVRVAISAETADAYLALRSLQAQLRVARKQEAIQAHLVDLVARRLGQGVAAARELQRATGELERVRASIPPLRSAIDGQLYRLDVLLGSPAGTHRDAFAAESAQPIPPQPAGSAAPADLLRRRPDVVAAERRLAASDARVGAAIAEYYPHVNLQGLLGWESVEPGTLLSASAQQSGGILGLRWRLFDFGRVDAEVAAARGLEAQELAVYRSSVLRATQDVETALSRFVESRNEERALVRQIDALSRARDQAQEAYAAGVLPLIDVLDAERELLAASDRLAEARGNEARAAVASYRALGGGWSG